MTREEAIHTLRHEPISINVGRMNGKARWLEAYNLAIRSLEAWDKVKKDLADMWLEGYSPHIEVMEIIDKHLKEVEE